MEHKDPELRLIQNHRPLTSADVHLELAPPPMNRGKRQSVLVLPTTMYEIAVKCDDRVKILYYGPGSTAATIAAGINDFHQRLIAESEGVFLHVWEDGPPLPAAQAEPEEVFQYPDVSRF